MMVHGSEIIPKANLQGVNLQYASLAGANLGDANLMCADLSSTFLRGANLQGADLRGANLRYSDLQDADLQGANLRGANLRDSDLNGANLAGANLEGISFRNVAGNGSEIINIYNPYNSWIIAYTKNQLAIGCQQNPIEDWREFNDEFINNLHADALYFWDYTKDYILNYIKGNPAI